MNDKPRVTQIVLVALLALALVPSPAHAQTRDERAPAETGPPRWETGLHLQGLFWDNFFQLPDEEPQDDVAGARAEGRLTWRPSAERPLALFAEGGATAYDDGALDTTLLLGTGLVWDGERDDLDVGLRLELDRPSFEAGDTFGTADLVDLGAVYARRLSDDWEVSGLAEVYRLEYEESPERDNDFGSLGAALRYRGWGYDLSPELGVELGRRDAVDPDEDHDQTDVWLKLRSAPIPPLYLTLRFRHRLRDYSIDDPLAGNFGREDDRNQVTLTADWEAGDLLTWTLYYAWEDADSTKPSRVFTTQLLGLGARFAF